MDKNELILYRGLMEEALFQKMTDLISVSFVKGQDETRDDLGGEVCETVRELIELAE